MKSCRKSRRVHPLAYLVLWLGIGLLATLAALVHVVGRPPSSAQLEASHMAGMRVGYSICLGVKESDAETLPRPRLTATTGGRP